MAAPAAALSGEALAAAKKTEGMLRTLVDALNANVLTFTWGRDPKNYKRMRLESVQVNITTGLILGGVALALLWEAANWFAQAINKAEADIPTLSDLANSVGNTTNYWITQAVGAVERFAGAVPGQVIIARKVQPQPGATAGTVTIPATAGQAYNAMIRDLIVAGPGQAALAFRGMISNLVPQS